MRGGECMGGKILVLGSSNIDFILRIPRFHAPGETILGQDLVTAYGGKGANQAIAAKRLGGEVTFLTKLGNDHYGKGYRRYLKESGLPLTGLLRERKVPSGMALIEVNPEGENRIIVSPGANRSLSREDLKKRGHLWRGVRVFVTQLEVSLSTVAEGLKAAKQHGALTLLNPSPPVSLSPQILSRVDYLVPNEVEIQFLTGLRGKGRPAIRKMGKRLLERGVQNVVVTLGPRGLLFMSQEEEIGMEAFKVDALDTTAAGDAFMGALALGLCEGRPVREVLRLANGAGALAATKLGAQPSLPTRKDLDRFLREASRTSY
jgi:ribokinase